MGDIQDNITIKKNRANMILDASKGVKYSMMFYLKAEIYSHEGSKPQEANINMIGYNKDGNDKKYYWRKKLGLPS